MPVLGEIKRGAELGYKGQHRYIWQPCASCGKARWVWVSALKRGKRLNCQRCSARNFAEKNPAWKGGRVEDHSGYIRVKLHPGDFFYPMTNKHGYVFEHRLVVAKHLGRNLHSWEVVHHRDGIRTHNEYKNLQLTMGDTHGQLTRLEKRVEELQRKVEEQAKRITLLEGENAVLKAEPL